MLAWGAVTDFELSASGPSTWDSNRKATYTFTVKLKRTNPPGAAVRICIGNTGSFAWDSGQSPVITDVSSWQTNASKTVTGTVKAQGSFTSAANINFTAIMGVCPGADSNTVASPLGGSTGGGNTPLAKLTKVGNGAEAGNFCDKSMTTLATGQSMQVKFTHQMAVSSPATDNGRIMMKTQTDKFGWRGGTYDHPNVTFRQTATEAGYLIDAKTGAAPGTYSIDFAARDSAGRDSAVMSCKVTIPPPPVPFSTLKETFQHARCTTCHGFSASNTTKPGHSTSNCTSCHSSASVGVSNWHAPAASFDLRNKTDAQLCAMAKTAPAGKSVAQHLKDDALIKWAISDARVPNGTTLAKAPPANLTTWNQRVEAWIAGGMLCQ